MPGAHFEFIKVTDSRMLVTEIRPLKCHVDTSEGYKTSSRWMQYHHWKELKKILSNVIEEYRIVKSNPDLKVAMKEMSRMEGKTIRIGYMYKAYKHCSCLFMTPREDVAWTDDDDDDGDDDEPTDLKDKGGRYCGLTPYGELLVVSVSCKEPQDELSPTTHMKLERDFLKSLDPLQSRTPTISDYFQSQSLTSSNLKSDEANRKTILKGKKKTLLGKACNSKKKRTSHLQAGPICKKHVLTHSMKRCSRCDSLNIELTGRKDTGNDASKQQHLEVVKDFIFTEEESNSECTTCYSSESQVGLVTCDKDVEKEDSARYGDACKNADSLYTNLSIDSTSFSLQSNTERESQYQEMENASIISIPSDFSLKDTGDSTVSFSSVLELSLEVPSSPVLGHKRRRSCSVKGHVNEIDKKIRSIKENHNLFDCQVSESKSFASTTNDLPDITDRYLKHNTSDESKVEENCFPYQTRLKSGRLRKTSVPLVSNSSRIHENNLSIETINSQGLEERLSNANESSLTNEGFMNRSQNISERNQEKPKNKKLYGKKSALIHTSKTGRRKRRMSSSGEKTNECFSFLGFQPNSTTKLSLKNKEDSRKHVDVMWNLSDISDSVEENKVDKVSEHIKGRRKNIPARRKSGRGKAKSVPGKTEKVTKSAESTTRRVESESKDVDKKNSLKQPTLRKWVKRKKSFDLLKSKSDSNLKRITKTKSKKCNKSRFSTDLFASTDELSSPDTLNKAGVLDSLGQKLCENVFSDEDEDLPDLECLAYSENTREENKTVTLQGKESGNALPENVKLLREDQSENFEEKIETGSTSALHCAKPNTEERSPHDINTGGFEKTKKPWKSLKDISLFLESLPEEELRKRMEQYFEYLLDICKGKIPNERHTMFNGEARWLKNLNYELVAGAYTEDQHEFVALELYYRFKSVIKKACNNESTVREYVWKVLVPAFLLKIVMDTWNLSETEAEQLLERVSLRGSSDS